MKLQNKLLIATSFLAASASVYSATTYESIIDAGSSGTRLYFYKVTDPVAPKTIPQIEQVFAVFERDDFEDGIDNYVCDTSIAPKSASQVNEDIIVPLLNHLTSKAEILAGITPEQITVTLLATAGMRTAEKICGKAKVDELYSLIGEQIKKLHYKKGEVRTTDGDKEEGIWTWANLNYVEGTFEAGLPTWGDIEGGGSSTQIVFSTTLPVDPTKNVYAVPFDGKIYNVFSRSYLGLGQDDARKWLRTQPSAPACWAKGFLKINDIGEKPKLNMLLADGAYDFSTCTSLYDGYLAQTIIDNGGLPPVETSSSGFVGLDSARYAAEIFLSLPSDDPNLLATEVPLWCADALKFPGIEGTDKAALNMQRACPNGTYVNAMLFGPSGLFRVGTNKVTKTLPNNVNGFQRLTWTRGYILLKNKAAIKVKHHHR